MKNKLFTILSLIFMLPVLLLFTACGSNQLDQKATCNTNGNYTEEAVVQKSVIAEALGDQTSIAGSGYRMTATIAGADTNFLMNAIYSTNGIAIKYEANANSKNQNFNLYYTEGCLYFDLGNLKYKVTTNINDYINYIGNFSSFSSVIDPEALILTLSANNDVEVQKDGNNYKLTFNTLSNLNISGADIKNAVGFLNLDNEGNLVAINLAYKIQLAKLTGENYYDMNVTMSSFNDKINFPNFDGYKDFANLQLFL